MAKERIEDVYRKVGQRIQSVRNERGLTQEQLADRAQVSRPSIVHIEQGKQRLPLDRLYRIAAVLGTPVHHFMPPLEEFQDLRVSTVSLAPDPSTKNKLHIPVDAVIEAIQEGG